MCWDFTVLGKVTRKRGGLLFWIPREGPMGGCNLLDANNVEAEANQPVTNIFCGGVLWQVAYHRLYRLFGFGVEGEKGEVIPF
jgi:hypothetical protein